MEQLIAAYWKPVYFHIRRQGHAVEDAKDLTQQYFTAFLERRTIQQVDPTKGRLRSFILVSLRHFLCDEHDRRQAAKRRPPGALVDAEDQFEADGSFERDWATTVLERAFERLREQAPREARVVRAQLDGKTPYRELATELGTTEANVKVLVHRGRAKLRAILLAELRATVSRPGDEAVELADLFRAFAL